MSRSAGGHAAAAAGSGVAGAHHRAAIISMAVMLSIAIYGIIALTIISTRTKQPPSPDTAITLYVAALFLALASIAYRRTQLRWMRLQAVAGLGGRQSLVKHLFKVTVASTAIGDIIGLLGLMLSFLGGTERDVLIFSAVALLVSVSTYPRLRAWQSTVEYLASDESNVQ